MDTDILTLGHMTGVMIVLSASTKRVTLVVRAVLSALRSKKRKGGKDEPFPE
jgi:hypothetical protein